jgi:hypothetical protein
MVKILPGTDCLCDYQYGHGLAQTGRVTVFTIGRVIFRVKG